MKLAEHHHGQRLSLKGDLCTVRYVGPVNGRPGTWLGVEWDDTSRGKHNGTRDGVKYFSCRSRSNTAASFLRLKQPWNPYRTFLQALREKYMPNFHEADGETVYFSGKQAEEVGFQKFHLRQAKLQGIRVLVLDHMQIQHRCPDPNDIEAVKEICADITDLDLTGNLFETFDEITQLCKLLPKLKVLTLDGNRFTIDLDTAYTPLPNVRTLGLAQTLIDQTGVNALISSAKGILPSLESLVIGKNEYVGPLKLILPPNIASVDLSGNYLMALSDVVNTSMDSRTLNTLILKHNCISSVRLDNLQKSNSPFPFTELDLSHNAISSFTFFNDIDPTSFPNLKHLRVTGNPLYKSLISAEGKHLTAEDGHMLTIARLPQLKTLDYSKITEKERLNAETYYLGQIAAELARTPEGKAAAVLAQHPRYQALCDEYGEPNIQREAKNDEVNPNSLATKLVTISFILTKGSLPDVRERSWTVEIPKSFSIYAVLGMVGKRLGVMPLELCLILETNEKDPVGKDREYAGPEWWDSSDDEADTKKEEWVKRRVELVAGTRLLGSYVEGREADVRVELRQTDQN